MNEEKSHFEQKPDESKRPSWGKAARRELDSWLGQASQELKVAGAEAKEWAQKAQEELRDAIEDKPEDPGNPNFFKELGRNVKDIGQNLMDFFDGDKPDSQ